MLARCAPPAHTCGAAANSSRGPMPAAPALATAPFGGGPGARPLRAVCAQPPRRPSPGPGGLTYRYHHYGVGLHRRLPAPPPAAAAPSPDSTGNSSSGSQISGSNSSSNNNGNDISSTSTSTSSSVWPSQFAAVPPALSYAAPPVGYPRGPHRPAGGGLGGSGSASAPGGAPATTSTSTSTTSCARACEHLLFDFNARYMTAAAKNLPLASLSPDDATRTGGGGGGGGGGALAALLGPLGGGLGGGGGGGGGGLAAMRAFFDLQVELEAAAAAAAAPGGGGGLNLVKAAALVALDPNVQGTLDRVESIAAMVGRHCHLRPGAAARPEQLVRTINSVLFDYYRFGPARERYYHPESSSLARLLQYKTGSPTALGVLYIAVAERVGLRVAAVSLPSHFLVRPLDLGSEEQPVFIDPYGGGRLLDVAGVAALLHTHLHLPPPQELAAEAALAAVAAASQHRANGGGGTGTAAATSAASMDWYFGRRSGSSRAASGRAPDQEEGDEEDEEAADGTAASGASDFESQSESEEDDDDGVVPMYEPGAAAAAASSGAGGASGPSAPPPSALRGCWFAPYLAPVGKVEVVLRLLRGLREVYYVPLVRRQVRGEERRRWQAQQALSVLRLLRLVAPADESHVQAEALCLVAAGRRREARELLRGFLAQHPEAQGAVQTLFLLEAEDEALGRIAAMEAAARDKAEREAAAAASLKSRLAGLRGTRPPGFNPRDPHSVMSDPAFFSRMYGRLWDDNWWISAMLDQREEAEDDKKGGGSGGGGGGGGKK